MNYELRKRNSLPGAVSSVDLPDKPPYDIYERTFEFALRIVKLCQLLDEKPGVSRTLGRQLLRSGTSIGANIQEGKSGQSRKDFLMKFHIARKEARETLYWLRLLAAADIMNHSRLRPLTAECNELIAILTTIIKRTQEGSEKARVS